MKIQTNIAALNTTNRLKANQTSLTKTLEKLSSGYKINRAADDAAGLYISEEMRAQIRGLKRANLNASDGLSYVYAADAVTQEAVEVLQRMRELTVQSLNDTNTKEDRLIIQKEIDALKQGLNSMSEDVRYNGELKVVEAYDTAYVALEGIRRFDGPIVIQPGKNDEISFIANGKMTSISIPLGQYDSIEELADTMSGLLLEKNSDIVLTITEDRRLAVQVDNAQEIVKMKGSGASLFFDYHIGSKPGMIIGTTDFSTGDGKLRVYAGKNDTMSFYIGSTNKVSIIFPPGEYTRDQAIDFMNQQLVGTGAEALPYGDKNISIASDSLAVTGLNGNMFQVDIHTSVIYDNIFYGDVYKRNSSLSGMAPLANSLSFDTSDFFVLNAVTRTQTPVRLKIELGDLTNPSITKSYTQSELVQHIQGQLDTADVDVTVSVKNNRLYFESGFLGSGRDIQLQSISNGHVKYSFFTEIRVTDYPAHITAGRNHAAALAGYFKDRQTMQLDATNNELSLTINGQSPAVDIAIPPGTYTPETMRDYLNQQLASTSVSVSFFRQGDKVAFQLSSQTETIQLNASSARELLFSGEKVTSPDATQGRDGSILPPQEGTVGEVIYEKFPATVLGLTNIPTTVTERNKQLKFTLNGTNHTIELTPGNYNQESLLQHLNVKLTGSNVTASIENNKLKLTTTQEGWGVRLTNISGFGMDFVQQLSAPTFAVGTSKTPARMISDERVVVDTKIIDSSNNKMAFEFFDNGSITNVELTVANGTYSPAQMVTALNTQLQNQGLDNKLAFSFSSGQIALTAKIPGSQYRLSNGAGALYTELFERRRQQIDHQQLNGATFINNAYTVGRQDLGATIEIFPTTNDILTFDLQYRGSKYTIDVAIPPGAYSRNQFITVFNQSMSKKLGELGLAGDTLVAQIGGTVSNQNISNANKFTLVAPSKNDGRDDRGAIVIDSIRGSAAYSIFYQSDGPPKPSYVTGMRDLSQGLTIVSGQNDTLAFDVNHKSYQVTFPAGNYDANQLLKMLNDELSAANTGLIASYADNFLRLSYKENGMVPIDGFTGNARSSLFFKTELHEPLKAMVLHIGANSNQNMEIRTAAFSDRLLRINTLYVGTRSGGERALVRLDAAIKNLSDQRGYLGAVQNRLEHVTGVNSDAHENLTAAESRIRDADMAKEMMSFVKQDILSQTMQAMLAQANKASQAVVQLASGS